MKTQVSDVSSVKKKMHIEVPAEKVKAAFDRALDKIQKEASVKGFRKGKVPRDMVQKMYQAEWQQEALEEIVQATYVDAMQAANLIPISRPDIQPGQLIHGAGFTYDAIFEVRPEVKVKNYAGLDLTGDAVKVTDDELNAELKRLQEAFAQVTPAAEGAIIGADSVITADFSGKVDGQEFPGSSATDFVIDIPGGNLLLQFADALKGAKVGDVRELEIPYPADYFNKDLAGKSGHFTVTVKEIRTKAIPELNDDFAKDLAKGGTLAELKEMIKTDIRAVKEQVRKRELGQQALQKLIETHDFEIPETLRMMELRSLFEQFQHHLEERQQTLESVGASPEKFIAEYTEIAGQRVRGYLILDAISEAEAITVSPEDIEEYFQGLAAQSQQPVTKIRAFYDENERKNALKVKLIQEKTLDFVINKAKIKEKGA